MTPFHSSKKPKTQNIPTYWAFALSSHTTSSFYTFYLPTPTTNPSHRLHPNATTITSSSSSSSFTKNHLLRFNHSNSSYYCHSPYLSRHYLIPPPLHNPRLKPTQNTPGTVLTTIEASASVSPSQQQQHLAPGVTAVPTSPYHDQKAGTSGLRKPVKTILQSKYYVHNYIQALLHEMQSRFPDTDTGIGTGTQRHTKKTLVVAGDGRYYNPHAIVIAIHLAAANGFPAVTVPTGGLMSTPAVSNYIRVMTQYKENDKEIQHFTPHWGALMFTASHNPGGEDGDWGCKVNTPGDGAPAKEDYMNAVFDHARNLSCFYSTKLIPDTQDGKQLWASSLQAFHQDDHRLLKDLPWARNVQLWSFNNGAFHVQVVDSVHDYLQTLKSVFDFNAINSFLTKIFPSRDTPFRILYNAMNAVGGVYAKPIFVDELGAPMQSIMNATPLPDFGLLHPDPNLTYAKDLVDRLDPSINDDAPDFGAASDGDADRNMILGRGVFVTPSDSLAIIAHYAPDAIPYFKNGIKGVARSMPTSGALDLVANAKGYQLYETPTGWKYFGNLMDAQLISLCGEESFGTGSDHIREKDGIWAILAWLSILAYRNRDGSSSSFITVKDILHQHWLNYGRNFYVRHDYEAVSSESAQQIMSVLRQAIQSQSYKTDFGASDMDEFSYVDLVDTSRASQQGIRLLFKDGSRIVFRLSGTGSQGATVRIYIEKFSNHPQEIFEDPHTMVKSLVEIARKISTVHKLTGRDAPTVIT